MDQSEFEGNACNRSQERENGCGQVMIGFGLVSRTVSHWLKKMVRVVNQSKSVVKQNQSNYQIEFRHSIETRSIFRDTVNSRLADTLILTVTKSGDKNKLQTFD